MDFYLHDRGFWEPQDSAPVKPSYPSGGNAECFTVESESHWFSARNETLEWAIGHFPFSGDFVDVGGGNGYQLRHFQEGIFADKQVVSAMCEPGVEGCIHASERGVKNVYHCDFRHFPAARFHIGAIGLFDVLEHVEHDIEFLLEAMTMCPSGTLFYITVPAMRVLWSSADTYACHFRRYDRTEFDRLVRETGLVPVYRTYFFSYYAPFVWILRVLTEKFRRPFSTEEIIEREGRFHRRGKSHLSWLLGCFHKAELLLIRLSIRLPFGTSMLMVLKKK